MTSKEALEILLSRISIANDTCAKLRKCIKGNRCLLDYACDTTTCCDYSLVKSLEDDLEVLDILKGKMSIKCLSGHYIICDNLSSLSDNGNEKDFEKVKAWLERKSV